MRLYMYISMAVVLLSTVSLFIIFQRKNLKDLRYRIGLVLCAVLACTGSLLFPGLTAVFSANLALRFFIVFFLSIFIYILALFIVLILVFQFVSKEKMDNLVQKWEEKKQNRKNVSEMKLKRIEAQTTQSEFNSLSGQQQSASTEFSIQPVGPEASVDAAVQQDPVVPIKSDANGEVIMEATRQVGSVPAAAMESQVALEQFSSGDQPDGMAGSDQVTEAEESDDLVNNPIGSSAISQDNIESSEKIVDTSDIIDKMGIDAVTDSVHPVPDQQDNSLAEMIKKAFLLKQQGDVMEAAVLYMTALDQKPDNDTAFWIVLDICAIYKTTGHADLAEDILLTYMDAFEHLMSEEVKDQILQSLYEG